MEVNPNQEDEHSLDDHDQEQGFVVVIEARTFLQESIVRGIASASHGNLKQPNRARSIAVGHASFEAWSNSPDMKKTQVMLVSLIGMLNISPLADKLVELCAAGGPPVAVLVEGQHLEEVMEMLDIGIKGIIPCDTPLDIGLRALWLISAGGTYIPASCFQKGQQGVAHLGRVKGDLVLSARELRVAHAVSEGKANKVIAKELSMKESTVKVHVRKIMRKLNVKNRTEVALHIANSRRGNGINGSV